VEGEFSEVRLCASGPKFLTTEAGGPLLYPPTTKFEASGERHEELLGAVALAQDFQTWRTLVRQQELSQDRAVELMVGMVRCLMRT
jgi:hypothetical protein